jgi:hypothetical protein
MQDEHLAIPDDAIRIPIEVVPDPDVIITVTWG